MTAMSENNTAAVRRIAVCCDRGLVAPYFSRCSTVLLFTVQQNAILGQQQLGISGSAAERAAILRELGADCAVCGSVTPEEREALENVGVTPRTGLLGEAEMVICILLSDAAPAPVQSADLLARPARRLRYGEKS